MVITGATGYSSSQMYDDICRTISEKEADRYRNAATNYHHVVTDSHFFTDIDQIIAFVGYMHINKKAKKDLLIALENTKKNGYNLLKTSGIEIMLPTPKYIPISTEGLNEKEIDDLIRLNKELLNFKLKK